MDSIFVTGATGCTGLGVLKYLLAQNNKTVYALVRKNPESPLNGVDYVIGDLTDKTGLDTILHGILPGDNIVFQIDSIDQFIPFVHAFCKDKNTQNRKLIYFRFADLSGWSPAPSLSDAAASHHGSH